LQSHFSPGCRTTASIPAAFQDWDEIAEFGSGPESATEKTDQNAAAMAERMEKAMG